MLTQPSKLDIVDSEVLPVLKMSRPLPNELYPSDHVPIAFTLEFKSSAHSVDECARAWALQVMLSTVLSRRVRVEAGRGVWLLNSRFVAAA